MLQIAVLMPVYEEGERLALTLRELALCTHAHSLTVFIVDDGSQRAISLDAALTFPANTERFRIVHARHPVNLGQGAAIETARRLALDPRFVPIRDDRDNGFDVWITMDSDGQHGADDALKLAKAIEDGADVALGDRFAGASEVPTTRRALLWLARVFERWTTGLVLSDAHNGLRAFGPRAIVQMRLRQNRMAHATEMTRRISIASSSASLSSPLRVVEVPVSVRYTKETLAKGQTASGAIAILVDLFQAFLFAEKRDH